MVRRKRMMPQSQFALSTTKVGLLLLFFFVLAAGPASAQVQFGTPKYESFGGGPFDSVNLGDLNVHFSIPVLHKPGRESPFNFDLTYDSTFWQTATVNGNLQWYPAPPGSSEGGGWRGSALQVGELFYYYGYFNCPYNNSSYPCLVYYNFAYIDGFGTSHPFSGAAEWLYTISVDLPLQGAITFDGSGYTLNWDASNGSFQLYNGDGNQLIPAGTALGPGSPASTVDRNGNEISEDSNATFTDTLGTQVLTETGTPIVFTFKDTGGNPATVALTWAPYTIKTNFLCPGVAEYPPYNGNLIDRVTLPNGTYYQFHYEATPGSPGSVTAPLASLTLPTGRPL